MIEQILTVIVGVGIGSMLGTWLGSKLLTRNLLKSLEEAAQSETLRTILNQRAEEIGASFARGTRKGMKDRFDFIEVPQIETEDKT